MNQKQEASFWRKHKKTLIILTVITAFFMLLFRHSLFLGQYFLSGDPFAYSIPLRMAAWDMIRQGMLPLWTPYVFGGYPLFSMAQLALAYPLTWGYLFMPGYKAEMVFVLAPYLLAPMFTYAYVRELGRSRLASLLAGLAFGYGGLMTFCTNGWLSNSMMWLPLILIALERVRVRRFIPSLLAAAGGLTMSLLAGTGQGFVYLSVVVSLYAVFLGVIYPPSLQAEEVPSRENLPWLAAARWKPLILVMTASLLTVGLGAFQIRESMRAVNRSVRGLLRYETFVEGSFTAPLLWKSWLEPIYHYHDSTTYVAPLALLLALVALLAWWKKSQRDVRILFWAGLAGLALVLMLGENTPLYPLVYRIPMINRFRVPARHSFEWSFAVAMLSAYGWDAARVWWEQRRKVKTASPWLLALGSLGLIASCAAILFWQDAVAQPTARDQHVLGDLDSSYLGWKAVLFLLTLVTVSCGWWVSTTSRGRGLLLAGAIAVACFAEPSLFFQEHVFPLHTRASRYARVAPVTRFLQQFPPVENRVYTQIALWAEAHKPKPVIDALNWTAGQKLHNLSGYEPLMLERLSRAMNSEDWERFNRVPWLEPDYSLFGESSHVLDLLNVTYVATYDNLGWVETQAALQKDGIRLGEKALDVALRTDQPFKLTSQLPTADTLALVTSMARSTHLEQGTPVARITIQTQDGHALERELRAGIEVSEWAHERADVRATIRHQLAPTYDSEPGDAQNSFSSHRYWARISLGEKLKVTGVILQKLRDDVDVILLRASLADQAEGTSAPMLALDSMRWEQVYQQDGALVFRNQRALPRTWLTPKAEAVNQAQAWERIRGYSKEPFDPRQTALLEIAPGQLPPLTGQPLSPDSSARVTSYSPNRFTIETEADQPAVLVVSELFYDGWQATLDGVPVPIYKADYLLRGVAVPAGKHRVVMRYAAPMARSGFFISQATFVLMVGLALWHWRNKKRASALSKAEAP